MKRIYLIVLTTLISLCIFSCRDDKFKSLSELKKDQKKTIERIIKNNSFKVKELKDKNFPKSFDKDVFYKFPNGLYMRVLDEGDKEEKAVKDKTIISVYADGYMSHKDKERYSDFNSLSNGEYMPIDFLYTEFYNQGDIHYQLINNTNPNGISISQIMCEGLAYPMTLLGNNARVSLIIPFELCPSFAYQNGATMVITEAKYVFKNNIKK